jgi:hypothetical protein
MGYADKLSAPLAVSAQTDPLTSDTLAEHAGNRPANLRGRCALLFLLGLSVLGYGAMFYLGQSYLKN